jgi:XTP/dITP diphosphohydrolase
MRLVLATRNDHKVREVGRLLAGVTIEPLPDHVTLPPEVGETYAENALGKARAAAAALGRPAIADDSGIESAALGGAPGIYSARFAGPGATDADNLAKLRAEAPAGSALRYVCVVAYATPNGEERTFTGTSDGTLSADARGSGGFGYDPAFLPDDVRDGRTMAELSDGEKDAISHRGRAARALLAWLRAADPGGDAASAGAEDVRPGGDAGAASADDVRPDGGAA